MKDKKQKNRAECRRDSSKAKEEKEGTDRCAGYCGSLVVWIGISIHNATKQVAMAVNTVEVEPVQKRDLSDTISVKGTVAGAQQHECDDQRRRPRSLS